MFGWDFELLPAYFLEPLFKDIWTLDFYLITLVGMFAPVFVYLGGAFRSPVRIFRLLFKSAVPYISLIVVSMLGIVSYLLTGRAAFVATGDRVGGADSMAVGAGSGILSRLHTNRPVVFGIEFALGVTLTYLSLMTVNFALLTISSCLLLSPLVARYGWDNRAISVLVSLPLAFVLLAFGSMGMGFLGMQGFGLFFLALHF